MVLRPGALMGCCSGQMGEPRRAGVGLVLEARGRGPSFVAELAPGGSADRCGRVRVGDQLLRVDGQIVQGLTPADLSQIISGPEGTAVRLAFRRITSNFFAENEDNFEVTLIRAVPQALPSARFVAPAGQLPAYQETHAPVDASGSYMGDATVLPGSNYTYAPPQDMVSGRLHVQQRRMMEDPQRPTTFHGFPNELPRETGYVPEHYSSNRNSIQTSPAQPTRTPHQWDEPARQQPAMTATGTPVRMQRASIPSPAPAPTFGQAQADEFNWSGIGRDGGGEGVDMKVLEDELQTLLTFVKSGYTNATHQESEWMQVHHAHSTNICNLYLRKREKKTESEAPAASFFR